MVGKIVCARVIEYTAAVSYTFASVSLSVNVYIVGVVYVYIISVIYL